MLTPADILNKEFKRGFRGYDEQEVNDFLDEIVADMEKLQRDNERLTAELEVHKQGLNKYQQMEKNLQDTLMVAQQTADEVIKTARQRSEEMRSQTEAECKTMQQQAEIELDKKLSDMQFKFRQEQERYESLVLQERQFVVKMRALMRTELELLEDEGVRTALGGGIVEQKGPELTEEMLPEEEHKEEEQSVGVERDIRVLAEQRKAQQAREAAAKAEKKEL